MNIKDLVVDYQTLIAIMSFVVTIMAVYFKLQTGIKAIDAKIVAIEEDRDVRWKGQKEFCYARQVNYDKINEERKEKDDKTEKMLGDILREVGKINGSIGVLKTHVEYLREKK